VWNGYPRTPILKQVEHFEIKNNSYLMIRKGLGILIILTAIAYFASYVAEVSKIIYLMMSLFFLLYGIYQITNGFGLERAWFTSRGDYIIIKWINFINPVQIHNTRISKISLTRTRIEIHQKAKKPLKLDLGFLDRVQKKEVYDFLIGYAKTNNIELGRDFK
jgi:hypothetical protein